MIKRYLLLLSACLLFGSGFYISYRIFHVANRQSSQEITSDTIVSALQHRGFLVVQSYIAQVQVHIDKSTGNSIKDLFWKQDISASANTKVSTGIDLSKITKDNVVVKKDVIEIFIPDVQQYSVEIFGDITLTNKQGILKKIFDNDSGYNEAVELLKEKASQTAQENELKTDAREEAINQIRTIVELIDQESKTIIVSIIQ